DREPERAVALEGPDHRHLQRPAQDLDGDTLDVVRRHGVDQRELLVDGLDLAEQQLLVGQPERNPVGRLQLEAEPALGELFGPGRRISTLGASSGPGADAFRAPSMSGRRPRPLPTTAMMSSRRSEPAAPTTGFGSL